MTWINTWSGSFFRQEIDKIDAIILKYLQRFENGWLEQLIEKWGWYYFKRQNSISDEQQFKNVLRSQIDEYIKYISTKHKKNDWDNIVRINWIKETYKELLSDNEQNSPKQEVLIEKVGARGRIIKILDWVRGK